MVVRQIGAVLVIFLTLLFTYVFASDLVFLIMRRLTRSARTFGDVRLFILTRGTGPMVLALVTYVLLLCLPGLEFTSYFAIICLLFGTGFFFLRAELPGLRQVYASLPCALRDTVRLALRGPWPVLIGIACLVFVVLGVGYPIVEHDSLTAVIEARIMLRDQSLANYLAVGQPDDASGYYVTNFRTPFLQTLYVWFGMAAGPARMDLLARTASPIYGLHCLALLAYVVYRRWGFGEARWATLLLVATPLFFYMSYNNSTDTPRLYFSFLSLVWFAEWIGGRRNKVWPLTVATGVFAGFSLYGHLLGLSAVLAGALGRLWNGRRTLRAATQEVVLLGVVTCLAGAQFHYLVSSRVFPHTRFLANAADLLRRDRMHDDLLRIRGQGETPLGHVLFGRLQIFTGVEHFGFIFPLALAGIAIALRRRPWPPIDWLMLAALAAYAVMVLSGLRKLSWSNPRYMGSSLMIAAYLAVPALAALGEHVARHRFRSLIVALLVGGLAGPVVLVAIVRGAKVELTNNGDFYPKLRSLVWLRAFAQDPPGALGVFWKRYAGIRKTIRYASASDEEKLRHSHDYFAAVQYLNGIDEPDVCVLLFRDARFFYYSRHRGLVWYHPDIWELMYRETALELYAGLKSRRMTHVLVDEYSERLSRFADTPTKELLADDDLVRLVFRFGTARVYKLRSTPAGGASVTIPGDL